MSKAFVPTLSAVVWAALFAMLGGPAAAQTAEAGLADLGTRTTGSDWPRFLGPSGDGRSPETGLSLAWPGGGPPVRWHQAIGEGYSMATVARGRLFLFDRHRDRARLSCLKSETGEELWRSEYPTAYEDYYRYSGGPRASPVFDDGRVYAFGVEGRLRAHDAGDGKVLWDVDTTARYGVVQNFFGVGATPAVEGDLLIVPVGGSPPESPAIHTGRVQGNGTGIVAFDKRTGEERYRLSDELASYASPVLVSHGGRRWGFAFTRGGLLGFEPTTGEQDFFFPWRARILESVNAANPVVVGDTVFITESYGPGSALLRFEPKAYEVVWQDPRRPKSMESHWSTPIHHQGHLYGSSGSSTGNAELRCLEHRTGKVRWSQPGLGRSTLLYVDGHLIVLGEYGRLTVIEATPERYREVAALDLGSPAQSGTQERPVLRFPAWNAPILSHGLLYVRGKDRLVCLDLLPDAR